METNILHSPMFVSAYEHRVSAYYRVCLISLSLDAAGDFFPYSPMVFYKVAENIVVFPYITV